MGSGPTSAETLCTGHSRTSAIVHARMRERSGLASNDSRCAFSIWAQRGGLSSTKC